MLWRLILRLTFKLSLPLVAILGVLSYGHYMRGGDPGALWRTVAGGAGDRLASVWGSTRDSADNVSRAVGQIGNGPDAATTDVWTWKDENGVTHFGSQAPANTHATSITIDNRTNVLAPIQDTHESTPDARGIQTPINPGQSAGIPATTTQLPGMAGFALSSGVDASKLPEGVDLNALVQAVQPRVR
ncbi:MAG: DUF4124 domain-containing protein [Granulosicoccus sp.]